jgi:hypothetical protein
MMNALDQGANPLFMNPNPDEAGEFFARKSRAMIDKRYRTLSKIYFLCQNQGVLMNSNIEEERR